MKSKKKLSPWLSQDTLDLADERCLLKEAGLHHSKLYRKLCNEIQTTARRDKNNHLTKLCKETEDHSSNHNSRNLFKGVKDLTCRRSTRLTVVKDKTGQVLTESDDIKNRWREYWLYASREVGSNTPLNIEVQEPDILLSEVNNAIHKLKTNKPPGIDDIPSELLRTSMTLE